MKSTSIVRLGLIRPLIHSSSIVLVSLVGVAEAEAPELFTGNPALSNDFNVNLPATGSSNGFRYHIVQGMAVLEGDMLLGLVDQNGNLPVDLRSRGVGPNNLFARWPDGIVIYEFPYENSLVQQNNVTNAIAHWEEFTTLRFVERTVENADQYEDYITFANSAGCASYVGMIGGAQEVFISDNCSEGSVIHEIGHAIGLFHEHTRPDRDGFVTISWDDVRRDALINFESLGADVTTYSDYDYNSIMHYGKFFFSTTGNPTIIVADDIEIGQREALSPLDIQSSNSMYETDLAIGTPVLNSTSNGTEIDVTIYNLGDLGAHTIELVMLLQDNSTWTDMSVDSSWDCLTYNSELKCTRDTLHELTESVFTVRNTSTIATIDDLSMRLVSKTQDSDSVNNAYNDAGVEWVSMDVETTPLPEEEREESDEPVLQGANGDSDTESGSDTDTDSDSDTDTDSGSDTDTDSGSGSDTDSGSDSDTDSGSDSDTDSGSDSNTDSGSDSDTESGSDSDTGSDSDADTDSGSDTDTTTITSVSESTDSEAEPAEKITVTGEDTKTASMNLTMLLLLLAAIGRRYSLQTRKKNSK